MALHSVLWNYVQDPAAQGVPEFTGRLEISLIKTALAVVGEAGSGTGHDKRHALGVKVLNNPGKLSGVFLRAIAALDDGSVLADSAAGDTALDSAVSSVFSDIAGVKSGE